MNLVIGLRLFYFCPFGVVGSVHAVYETHDLDKVALPCIFHRRPLQKLQKGMAPSRQHVSTDHREAIPQPFREADDVLLPC